MLKIRTSKEFIKKKSEEQLHKEMFESLVELKRQSKELLLNTIGVFIDAWLFKLALNCILRFLGVTCIPFCVALAFTCLVLVIKDIK
ncbi:hypothetical protein [Clostridium botulinum]|uniref:hypothetical protein n=2 Tax=Clostridium botulinum TaxID=1491 RepID=UPI001E52D0A9|nr:hypothetical protein [Clostridium botulinum]MCD3223955.1 hypothetical protein [Clostridium botulinum C/D]